MAALRRSTISETMLPVRRRRFLPSWRLARRSWFRLQRFKINLNQDHREVFVRSAALMRSAARHDHEIALLNFESLAVDDAWAAPFAGISFFWRIELAAQHERCPSVEHVVHIIGSIMQLSGGASLVLFVLHGDPQLHARA